MDTEHRVRRALEFLEADPRAAEAVEAGRPMVMAAAPQIQATGRDPWLYLAELFDATSEAWARAEREAGA